MIFGWLQRLLPRMGWRRAPGCGPSSASPLLAVSESGLRPWERGFGMGNAINGALQGTARNPEAGGKIMTTMIIGLALIESLCIYAWSLLHYGLQIPGPRADVQRHPEKLWRLTVEHLPDGFPTRPVRFSQK